jgi:hypothetical protein
MTYQEWTVREGSTEPIVFVLYDGSSVYDLTGYTALQMRLVPHDGGSTLTFTPSDSELAVTDNSGGEVTFYPAADTLSFSDRAYDVYFWVTDGNSYKISFPHNGAFLLQMIDNP